MSTQTAAKTLTVALALGISGLMMGCGKSNESADSGTNAKAAQITAADRTEAEKIFSSRCATCHGADGMGDGPGAAALNPKPRNYHDAKWQASVDDEKIEKTIVYGGAAVGLSPLMAANPDLQSKPGVVGALRERVRSFAKK